ncbi:MAG TPA: ABC transporter ATP-binding protein [Acetobacteraceae bacterium]|nr:ABC transporter ATP-binding protein [Acetobacteraceae bacterium]
MTQLHATRQENEALPARDPPSAATAAISLRNVTKYFYKDDRQITALSDISLEIPRGAFVSIVGPSGCGKSTILDMIAGFEAPTTGTVRYGTREVRGISVGIGYLTQHDTLLPWRTVWDNVRLPLDIQSGRLPGRRADAETQERVAWAINLVGLAGFEQHAPAELSGGMRKRAALAQVLVYARETVLMDEPFGALDFQMRLQMQAELLNIWSTERRTIVFVTHDIEEAIALSDQIVIMSRRPGRIRDIVTTDLPRPRDPVNVRFLPQFEGLYHRVWSQLDPPEGATPRPGAPRAGGGAP